MNKCKSYKEIIEGELNIPGDIYRHMSDMIISDDDNSELIVKMLNILLKHGSMKYRHLKLLLPYLSKNMGDDLVEYYESYIYRMIPVDSRLIELLCTYPKVLELYIGKYVELDGEYKEEVEFDYDYGELLGQIRKFIKRKYGGKNYERFLKNIPEKNYSIVFDGNNVLFSDGGKEITKKSYNRLIALVDYTIKNGHTPLVFIHQRNMKYIKKWLKLPLHDYMHGTPYNFNDDWFSLYYAIQNNCYLVSNDLFRDHINIFDTNNKTDHLKVFIKSKKLFTDRTFSSVIFTNNNIPVIIKKNDKIYVPAKSGYLVI